MKKANILSAVSFFIIAVIVLSSGMVYAQGARPGQDAGRGLGPYWYGWQMNFEGDYSGLPFRGDFSQRRFGGDFSGLFYQGPAWFPDWQTDPLNYTGGPNWLYSAELGSGPWFWQVYNGYSVSDIASVSRVPDWYVDPLEAQCVPVWYPDDLSNGPWFTYFLTSTAYTDATTTDTTDDDTGESE